VILFIAIATLMVGLSVAILLPSLLNPKQIIHDDNEEQNIRIARRRLEELEQFAEFADTGASDPDVLSQSKAEIASSLIDDLGQEPGKPVPVRMPGKGWTVLILLLIPTISAGLYVKLGNPDALILQNLIQQDSVSADSSQNPSAEKLPSIDVLVQQLEQKLADNPGSADGWALAARTYMSLGQFKKAEQAYKTLHQLVGDDPDVLTAWADATIMASGGAFSPEVLARIERALVLLPNHSNALWIAALGAESRAEYQQAVHYLDRLLPLLAGDQEASAEVTIFIGRMQQLSQSGKAVPVIPEQSVTVLDTEGSLEVKNNQSSTRGTLIVEVKLDSAMAARVLPDNQVYVFARAIDGPPMPLAVSRHRVSELPISIILDDTMAMMSNRKISTFEQVSVMARVSLSGNPVAEPGDIESVAVVTRTDNQSPLKLVINQVVK
jgi:cytochrome c-type biogenesis protein CcmH